MKIKSQWIIRLYATVIAWLLRALFLTVRVRIQEARPRTCPYEHTGPKPYLYCLWHDGVIGVLFCGKCVRMAGLVSQHEDGSVVAHAMDVLKIKSVRGSSRRGGAAALRQMFEVTKDYDIAIATDGPRGPRHVVKEGIVYLASQAEREIVPVGFQGVNAWRPRGRWTDMVIPLPFSTVYLFAGEPIAVPAGLSPQELAPYCDQLQEAMERVNAEVENYAGTGNGAPGTGDWGPGKTIASRPKFEFPHSPTPPFPHSPTPNLRTPVPRPPSPVPDSPSTNSEKAA